MFLFLELAILYCYYAKNIVFDLLIYLQKTLNYGVHFFVFQVAIAA